MLGGVILLSIIIPVGLKFSLLLGQSFDIRAQINDELGGLAAASLAIGEGLISISLLVLVLLAILALFVFLIPPLESLRQVEGVRLIVSPPRRLIQAIFIVFAAGHRLLAYRRLVRRAAASGHHQDTRCRRSSSPGWSAHFLPAMFGYMQVRQVQEESDELGRAVALTPGKYIRPSWRSHRVQAPSSASSPSSWLLRWRPIFSSSLVLSLLF